MKNKIQKARDELISNIGNSSKLETEYILKIRNQLQK